MVVYVACPYAHPKPDHMELRAKIATRYASAVWSTGVAAFSPLTHCHAMANLDSSFKIVRQLRRELIMEFDLSILQACDQMHVLKLPGWRESAGVKEEIEFAKGRPSIEVVFVEPSQIELAIGIWEGAIEEALGKPRVEKGRKRK